ncbi:DUF2793 domain-containing protein, partial [Xanthobacter aminoxidans]|uniref:phage head spike fiber domain-containing protein n=1 Tax=Xanthobacter aminoxidans TaxID=186280 RepID=UPI002022E226
MSFSDFYATGTVTVPAGGTAVIGAGTLWSTPIVAGDTLEAGGRAVRILDVVDNTHLTLAYGWPGAALAGSSYIIVYNSPSRSTGTYVAERVRELIERQRVLDDAVATYAAVSVGLDTPPGAPVEGDLYVVGTWPTGAWVGYAGYLAIWSGTAWRFTPPAQGMQVVALDTDMMWRRTAAGWSMWVLGDRLALNGRTPMLVADFVRDQYRLNGSGISASELFARSGVGKRVIGVSGLVEVVPDNILAFDHSAGRRHMMFEGAATNYIRYSNDFAGTGWFKDGGSTITANAAAAPDGAMTADRCQIASYLGCDLGTNITSRATFSVWLRSATGANQTVQMYLAYSTPDGVAANQNFTVTTTWQRFTLTGTPPPGVTGFRPVIAAGDVYAWGAQFETGSAATSLIATAGSATTRPADLAPWSGKAVGAVNTTGCTLAF